MCVDVKLNQAWTNSCTSQEYCYRLPSPPHTHPPLEIFEFFVRKKNLKIPEQISSPGNATDRFEADFKIFFTSSVGILSSKPCPGEVEGGGGGGDPTFREKTKNKPKT